MHAECRCGVASQAYVVHQRPYEGMFGPLNLLQLWVRRSVEGLRGY